MVFCKNCGTEVKSDRFCPNCGTQTLNKGTIEFNKIEKIEKQPEKPVKVGWFIVAVVIPFLGIILAIYGLSKHKEHSWTLMTVSIVVWLFWWLVVGI